MSYNPVPPRAWSRVQNRCPDQDTDNNGNYSNNIVLPYTGIVVPISEYYKKIAQINKGNILQYKANSAQLTKQQIYSQMAKGMWTNRTKTWATQSQSYSNPNTHSLKRSGAINITIDGVPTSLPVTCPQPFTPISNSLPIIVNQPGPSQPPLPPPPPEPSGPSNPSIPLEPIVEPEPIVIQDEGSLLCNIVENICTGETFSQPANNNCNLTTDSDVPGPIEELCWYNNIQTWFPRQRLTMNNSGNKWPQGYKGFTSALKPRTPYLTYNINSGTCGEVMLSWTYEIVSCFVVDAILIYVDGILVATVNPTNTSYMLPLEPGDHIIYIKNSANNIESRQSNTIQVALDNYFKIISNSDCKLTSFITSGSKVYVVECNESPEFGISKFCSASLIACASSSDISFLVIGAGGGGGCGYNKNDDENGYSGGGGGGGGGNIYVPSYTNPVGTEISLQIGVGGGGHTPGNAGFGASAGNSGTNSFVNDGTNIYTAYGGGGGKGIGATDYGGGNGGNATSISTGYGGGGGGGAITSKLKAVKNGGIGGTGTTTNGANGGTGTTSSGAFGGNSSNNPLVLPFLNVYLSQGGQGGNLNTGGVAGNNLATNTIISGQNSDYGLFGTYASFGNGGGGASAVNNIGAIGGNGGNGAIIIWRPYP
jgi:hypothetical protein